VRYQKESAVWKKSLYLSVIPLLAAITLFACNKTNSETNKIYPEKQEASLSAGQIDRFPAVQGESASASADELRAKTIEAISSHITNNFKYPLLAQELGLEGKIIVEFVIGLDGKVSQMKIIRKLDATTNTKLNMYCRYMSI